jgi:hypothetical protein
LALAVLERGGVVPERDGHRAAVLVVDEDVPPGETIEVLYLPACLAECGDGVVEPVPRDLVTCDSRDHAGGTISLYEV